MSFELMKKPDEELWLKVSGLFTVEDFEKMQSLILSELELYHKSRTLIILDDFTGWSKDPKWNDMSFMQEHGDQIIKMAIVGDEKWKDEMFMFVCKPFRSTKIEFFPENQIKQAKRWLSAPE